MRIILVLAMLMPLSSWAQQKDTVEMLFALDREFVQYRLEHGTYNAFAKYLAPDAVTLPPGEAPKVGLEAVLRDARDRPNTTVTWEPEAGDISGEMGYTWGLFSINTVQDDGTVDKQHGKYASIWKRQENGEWKVVVDSFSLNPPPE